MEKTHAHEVAAKAYERNQGDHPPKLWNDLMEGPLWASWVSCRTAAVPKEPKHLPTHLISTTSQLSILVGTELGMELEMKMGIGKEMGIGMPLELGMGLGIEMELGLEMELGMDYDL